MPLIPQWVLEECLILCAGCFVFHALYLMFLGIKLSTRFKIYHKYVMLPSYVLTCLGSFLLRCLLRHPQLMCIEFVSLVDEPPLRQAREYPVVIQRNGWMASDALANTADLMLAAATSHVPVAPALSKAAIPVYIASNAFIGVAVAVGTGMAEGAGAVVAAAVETGTLPLAPLGAGPPILPVPQGNYTSVVAVHLPNTIVDSINPLAPKPIIPKTLPCVVFSPPGVPLDADYLL